MQDQTPSETQGKPRKRATTGKRRQTYTVGFRLDAYYLSLLEKGASAYGISVHEYARQRLQELLDRQEETQLLGEIGSVQDEVKNLREDLARALEVLLVNTTKADSRSIREWIDTHLRRE